MIGGLFVMLKTNFLVELDLQNIFFGL